jgi:hypothetical protein
MKERGSCGNVRVCDAPPRESNWREYGGRGWDNVCWYKMLLGTIPEKKKTKIVVENRRKFFRNKTKGQRNQVILRLLEKLSTTV